MKREESEHPVRESCSGETAVCVSGDRQTEGMPAERCQNVGAAGDSALFMDSLLSTDSHQPPGALSAEGSAIG